MIFLGNKNIIPYIGDKNPSGMFLGETLIYGGEINAPNTIIIKDLNDDLIGMFSLNNENDFHIALILDPLYNFSNVHSSPNVFSGYTTKVKYNILNTETVIERKYILWRRHSV